MDKLRPLNGSLAVGSVGGDFNSWDMERRQQVDDTTGYTDGVNADHTGSGCFAWTLDFTGFAGKNAAGTNPGLAALSDTAVAVVATADTGCSYSGNFVIESLRVSHRKVGGAVSFSGRGYNKGAITEAWDVT